MPSHYYRGIPGLEPSGGGTLESRKSPERSARDRLRTQARISNSLTGVSAVLDAYQLYQATSVRRQQLVTNISALKASVSEQFRELAFDYNADTSVDIARDASRGIALTSGSIINRERVRLENLSEDIARLKRSERRAVLDQEIQILQNKIEKRWGLVKILGDALTSVIPVPSG